MRPETERQSRAATSEATPESSPESVAAVDLGSNSFHLVVGRATKGHLTVVDRLRERVALASGLDEDQRLTDEAQARALACLRRFGQRLSEMPRGCVRAVGTNSLRQAKNSREFLELADVALGHSIEVVSGHEEARLVYLGVAREVPPEPDGLLVVDIGGGSTELALGRALDVSDSESLYMGCVSWSERFFKDGVIKRKRLEKARLAARLELEPVERRFREQGWEACAGSSGTIAAVSSILRATGWTDGTITLDALHELGEALVQAGHADDVTSPGLATDRRPVLAGGLAILTAVMEALGPETMRPAAGALREGLLHDLIGRIGHDDARDRTVEAFEHRFHVDREQAARVRRTAVALFRQVAEAWGLDLEGSRRMLAWAARIHEIGLSVAHAGYQRHGAYLVVNSDMPGFSRDEQALLGALIADHRRKFRPEILDALPRGRHSEATRLCLLLRLAACLNRSRSSRPLPALQLEAKGKRLGLRFPDAWLDEHPLTRADLEQEAASLKKAGYELTLS